VLKISRISAPSEHRGSVYVKILKAASKIPSGRFEMGIIILRVLSSGSLLSLCAASAPIAWT